MKTLVISKPVYDFVIPLVEFPQDGDKFYINNSINTLSNIGSLVAITFAKYNVDVSFTGMVGEDYIGNKIKEILSEYKIDTTYIETSYAEKTCSSYKIYNSKTNKFTSIEENSLNSNLTKYKYEFIPDIIVMDNKDYSANLAAINNYPNSMLIYIGEKYTKESSIYCSKCKYVISNLKFASSATGVVDDLNKSKNLVTLFQKYIDIYNSNLIIRLDNFDILYCIDDEVRLIKNVNKNINNKENIFYSVLCFFLSQNIDIENSIKFTNKVMLSSDNDLNMIKNIPDYSLVSECLIEYKKSIDNQIVNNSGLDNALNEKNIVNENYQINNMVNKDNLKDVQVPNVNNVENNLDKSKLNVNQNGVNDVERL